MTHDPLKSGDQAPDFSLCNQDHCKMSLREILCLGSLVLYFYPKDLTKGCTTEALEFKEHYSEFQKLNTQIIGISKDSMETHKKFITQLDLPFSLLSDLEGNVSKAYGVWTQKSMYGRTYLGIERSTFFINTQGVIKKLWRKVKVPLHAQTVLEYIKTNI